MNKQYLTPKELMISRYKAFVNRDWEYVAKTSLNQTLNELKTSPQIEWLKLDVINSYDNIVEFKAYYRLDNKIEVMHEKSTFIKQLGMWLYKDGELLDTTIGRNESCPCQSGKKFKRCCGK